MRPTRPSARHTLSTLCAAMAIGAAGPAAAADAVSKPVAAKATPKAAAKPTPKTATKTAAKPATPRQQLKNEAAGLALATETAETISQGQLDVAARVLTGPADCEFKQRIEVQPLAGTPGYFTVSHQGKRYRMLPRETATGAVRLEDPVAGIVWLQIPSKSMLMNAKLGQRMVDNCLHSEQRAALTAVAGAAQGIGIVAQPLAAAEPAPAASR